MKFRSAWIILFIHLCTTIDCIPVRDHRAENSRLVDTETPTQQQIHKPQNDNDPTGNGEIISVRITSSVAVERSKVKSRNNPISNQTSLDSSTNVENVTNTPKNIESLEKIEITDIPPDLIGANIEYIKQLNAKKEGKSYHNVEPIHPFQLNIKNQTSKILDSEISESEKSYSEEPYLNNNEYNDNVPLARSIPYLPKQLINYDQPFTKPPQNVQQNPTLTTVNFNVVHDPPKTTQYDGSNQAYTEPQSNNQQFFNEPAKVYSQPAQIYSEPAKIYSEPAKIYSEPAKIYSVPAKIYSEPAKIYSEPAKFYSQPASLHLEINNVNNLWSSTLQNPIPTAVITTSTQSDEKAMKSKVGVVDNIPEKNYEVDEKVSVLTDGRSHGVQMGEVSSTTENAKVGYVVEGKQYRKYRVEERTSDGFIVGEYGVVRNEDGALRGVRYTADGEASPSLIYNALMKFLQLK